MLLGCCSNHAEFDGLLKQFECSYMSVEFCRMLAYVLVGCCSNSRVRSRFLPIESKSAAMSKRVCDPVEEWWPEPSEQSVQFKQSPKTQKQQCGKWRERTLMLAKAVKDGDDEMAVQLARLWWAGSPEISGLR